MTSRRSSWSANYLRGTWLLFNVAMVIVSFTKWPSPLTGRGLLMVGWVGLRSGKVFVARARRAYTPRAGVRFTDSPRLHLGLTGKGSSRVSAWRAVGSAGQAVQQLGDSGRGVGGHQQAGDPCRHAE